MTVISLPDAKGQFLLGLSWRHLDNEPKKSQLRTMAQERGEIVSLYHTLDAAWQAGFTKAPDGLGSEVKVASLFALAPLIAPARPAPWRAVFDIGNGLFWYLAVRDQQEIIPEGDFVGTLEEVSMLRSQHDAYGVWNDYDGDASVHALTTILRDLGGKRKPVRSFAPSKSNKTVIVASVASVVLLGAAGGGWWVWHNNEVAKEKAAQLARQRAAAAQNANKPVIPPWFVVAPPDKFMDACERLWRQQSLNTEGWGLSSWSCNLVGPMASATAEFTRAGGLASNAPGALDPDGSKSVQTTTEPLGVVEQDRSVMPQEASLRRIWSFAQRHDLALNLGRVPAPVILPGQTPPPQDPWVTQPVGLTLSAPPWYLGLRLQSVPGLRVTSLAFDGGKWSVQAQLFSARQNGPIPPSNGAT